MSVKGGAAFQLLVSSVVAFDSHIKVDLPPSLNQLLVELEMHHMMMIIIIAIGIENMAAVVPKAHIHFADFITKIDTLSHCVVCRYCHTTQICGTGIRNVFFSRP